MDFTEEFKWRSKDIFSVLDGFENGNQDHMATQVLKKSPKDMWGFDCYEKQTPRKSKHSDSDGLMPYSVEYMITEIKKHLVLIEYEKQHQDNLAKLKSDKNAKDLLGFDPHKEQTSRKRKHSDYEELTDSVEMLTRESKKRFVVDPTKWIECSLSDIIEDIKVDMKPKNFRDSRSFASRLGDELDDGVSSVFRVVVNKKQEKKKPNYCGRSRLDNELDDDMDEDVEQY